GRNGARRRRLRKQAAVCRVWFAVSAAFEGADRGERAIERAERARDQRLFGEIASVRYEIACGKIIRAVGDDVVIVDQGERVAGGEPNVMRFDGDVRIESLDCCRGAVDLRRADIESGMDHLALQIRE